MKDNKNLVESLTKIAKAIEEITKNEPNTNFDSKINRYYELSKELLSEITLVKSKLNENGLDEEIIKDFEEKNYERIEEIEYIISSSEESGVQQLTNYRTLQHNYYKIKNLVLDCRTSVVSNKASTIKTKLEKIEEKSINVEEKFEGIGSTILSTIVSLTVVVTAITAIDRIHPLFIPPYLLGIVWLGMTFIIFVNNLFNKNDFNSKQATILYTIITVLFTIVLLWSVGYVQNNNIEISGNNCQDNQS